LGDRILVFDELQRGHDAVLEPKVFVKCGRGRGETRRQDGRDSCTDCEADHTCSRKPCHRTNHVRTKAHDERRGARDRNGDCDARMSDERTQQEASAAPADSIDKDLDSANRRFRHAASSER
jgi:hypothetical protein